ncbi:MAG: Fe(2+) transporter permease subunit FeoB [Spirochaetales bacterium]|nr:Fe(2+) transporter permease subunit FeoB [Spirochaetales bacterium]
MERQPEIALAGNPNSGKTTIFNNLTGSSQRIGNWPGVTVEKKSGRVSFGSQSLQYASADCIDLPGIYSLSAESEDEIVTREYLISTPPDLVVNVIDASNLERNLYLTTQLLELGVPVVGLLNMMDISDASGQKIDLDHLKAHLGIPVMAYTATGDEGSSELKAAILTWLDGMSIPEPLVKFPNEIEDGISRLCPYLSAACDDLGVSSRWAAVKALEEDSWILNQPFAHDSEFRHALHKERLSITDLLKETPDVLIADHRYGCVRGIIADVVTRPKSRESMTDRIDRLVMHPLLGLPVFFCAMFLVFWVSINLGGAFIDFFDITFGALFVDGVRNVLTSLALPEFLIAILADGIGAGIQTVSTFVPVIFFMFLMLSLLEDSGYMARAAFLMDQFMRFLGLPGKAFVPMLVGFGCTVPAILAARTLDTRKDKLMTVFMAPLMSCGARLPVYALFAGAFFPRYSGLVVFSIYLAGILIAVLSGLLLKSTLFRGEPSHFIMELPRYHSPRFKHIMIHTTNRLADFIFRAGKVILFAVFILGLLGSLGTDGSFGNEGNEKSVLTGIGRGITPVFGPMGIENENWPAAVGLFTGVFAKEAIVGTLNGLYSQLEAGGGQAAGTQEPEAPFSFLSSLEEAFASIPGGIAAAFGVVDDESVETDSYRLIRGRFTPAAAYAYLLFVLIYIPCLAAFGTAVREIGAFYGTLMGVYLTTMAWIIATLFYQLAEGRSLWWILTALGGLAVWYGVMTVIGRKGIDVSALKVPKNTDTSCGCG